MRTGVRVGPFYWVGRGGGNGCLLLVMGVLALSALGFLSEWLGAWVAWAAIWLAFGGVPLLLLLIGIRGLRRQRRRVKARN